LPSQQFSPKEKKGQETHGRGNKNLTLQAAAA
jgi:hypothetical protein